MFVCSNDLNLLAKTRFCRNHRPFNWSTFLSRIWIRGSCDLKFGENHLVFLCASFTSIVCKNSNRHFSNTFYVLFISKIKQTCNNNKEHKIYSGSAKNLGLHPLYILSLFTCISFTIAFNYKNHTFIILFTIFQQNF